MKIKTKISIMIIIIILVVGFYIAYEANLAAKKIKLKVEERLTGKVILSKIICFQ
jgi:hypothetical protein